MNKNPCGLKLMLEESEVVVNWNLNQSLEDKFLNLFIFTFKIKRNIILFSYQTGSMYVNGARIFNCSMTLF